MPAPIGARMTIAARTSLEASAHLIRGERDDGTFVAGIPADGAALGLRHDFAAGTTLRTELQLARRDRRPGPGELEIPGFALINVSVSQPLGERLRLRAGIQNLLDKRYPISADDDDPEAPGRTYILAFELTL